MTDGRWIVDRPEVREDPISIPPLLFEGVRVQRERMTKKDIEKFGPLSDVKVAMRSKTTRMHRHTQIVAVSGLKDGSKK